ncbi:ATP-dependent DNA ligase, partial [Aureobasidium melanogenum]
MSTPSKRRKKNDGQPVRGLDYFFGKQAQAKQQPKETIHEAPEADPRNDTLDHDVLSDEALARKLQAEWDEQDRASQAPTSSPSKSATTTEANQSAPALPEHVKQERGIKEETPTPAPAPVAVNPFAGLGKKNTLSLQSATADDDTITYDIPFDQSPLTFDPQKYIPELKKQWVTDNGHATYALLTHCFVMVNSTQSRIKIVDTLVNALRVIIEGDPQSLLPAVWLATNSISPPYIDMELGLGGSAISKALKKVCGLDNAALKKLSDKYGDAGDVAFEAKKRQSLTLRKPKPLTIKAVFDSLIKISMAKGHGSVETKQRLVERLVQDARGAEESRYVVRTLVQHLRIGAVKTTMLIALSRAFLLSKPPGADFSTRDRHELAKLSKQQLVEVWAPAEEIVKACFARRPNYNDLVPTLLEIGVTEELLLRCGLAMHIPLRPMLGGITRDLGEMLTKLSAREFTCEYKYDGTNHTKLLPKLHFLFADKLYQANEHKSTVTQQAKSQSSPATLK